MDIILQVEIPKVRRPVMQAKVIEVDAPVAVGVPASRVSPWNSADQIDVQDGPSSSTMEPESRENFFDTIDLDDSITGMQGEGNTNVTDTAIVGALNRRYPLKVKHQKFKNDIVYNFVVAGNPNPVNTMQEEYISLVANKTWELIYRPWNADIVKLKWLLS